MNVPGPTLTLQDVHDFKARLPAMKYVRGDRQTVSNLWMFHSPKNDLRFAIQTDRDFANFVLLEGNIDAVRYLPYPLHPVLEMPKAKSEFAPSAKVNFRNGSSEWWCFREVSGSHKSGKLDVRVDTVHTDGDHIRSFSRNDFKGRELEFDNWLILCAAITRNARYSKHTEMQQLAHLAQSKKTFRLKDSLEMPGVDRSLMLSAIAVLLQKGQLTTELKRSLLTINSKMQWVL
jgi:hypothetical protein